MLSLALLLLLPLAQVQPIVKEFSTHWHPADTIRTGLDRLVEVVICPSQDTQGGHLLAVDSSGKIAELRYADRKWTVERVFPVGEAVTCATTGAPRPDGVWTLYVGTKSGRVIEVSRGPVGWTKREIIAVSPPIRNLAATEPDRPGPSQLFVIDGKALVTNLRVATAGSWYSTTLPPTEGGAGKICFDYRRTGLVAVTAGPKGVIYKFLQDSVGQWSGGPWATLSGPVMDMAASADPTARDIVVFYSGQDGIFRYLFYGRMEDEKSRLPIANGTVHLIGKGDQRRFNEFFAMSGREFCMFEYSTKAEDWVKESIASLPGTVVSTTFGPGRGSNYHQMYAAMLDGTVYEIVREGLEEE